MASPFLGGPERQMLGIARHLVPDYEAVFLSFAEQGRAKPLLRAAAADGFEAIELRENSGRFWHAVAEIGGYLRERQAAAVLCSGYKPDIIGSSAARRVGIPAIARCGGWTSVTWKVRLNELLDRLVLHRMDAVVCVSADLARRVRRWLVPRHRIRVIHNGISVADPLAVASPPSPDLRGLFADPPPLLVGTASRLSPEKGIADLLAAAEIVLRTRRDVGFVVWGDGPERGRLARQAQDARVSDRFVLAGFCDHVPALLRQCDLAVLPSRTEGLSNSILEAMAAGLPVLATGVGGTPELIGHGETGWLVPPRDPANLAAAILRLAASPQLRQALSRAARQHVAERFSYVAVARQYRDVLHDLVGRREQEAR